MKKYFVAGACCLALLSATGLVSAQKKESPENHLVKVSAKDLADIKRQVRLMRAEMAELNERIEQLTAQRDSVYNTEKGTEEKKEDHPSE